LTLSDPVRSGVCDVYSSLSEIHVRFYIDFDDELPLDTFAVDGVKDTGLAVSMTSTESESEAGSEDTESIVMVPSIHARRMCVYGNKNTRLKHTSHHYHHQSSKRRPPSPPLTLKLSYSVVDDSDSDIGCMGSGHASVADRLERALDSRARRDESGRGERVCAWDLKEEGMGMPSFSSVVLGDLEAKETTARPRVLSMGCSNCLKPIGYYGSRMQRVEGGKREDLGYSNQNGRRTSASASASRRMKMKVVGGGNGRSGSGKKRVFGRLVRLVCPKPSLTAFV